MPVYTPRQASATARTMPPQAGAEMYFNVHGLHGPVGAIDEVPAKRQSKYLIALGIVVVATVGIFVYAGKSSRNQGLSGIGELKLSRSLPAK